MPGAQPNLRAIVTPEGTTLPFVVASVFDRAAAVTIDLLIIHFAVFLLFLIALLIGAAGLGLHALAIAMLASFVLRNFYFSYFEIRSGGVTPGKKRLHLRVISRSGGPLSAESVLTRNLTREFEIFLPLTVLSSPESILPALPAGAALFGCLWLLVGAFIPLFNRDRLRLGDLLGGTIVVSVPRTMLLDDPAAVPKRARAAAATPRFSFAQQHLDQYGIEELHVLEGLVRREAEAAEADVRIAVMRKIIDKIGWEGDVSPADASQFLSSFYRQLRARLEHKALFGDRQLRKRAGKLARRGPQGPSQPNP